ncbi:hypothetical protein TRFO_18528 [Tritrichomonas foetus]|uniref:Uncharacterized protein n=1 Tax=Tritrichomonas foetus TaxID=1144522 RepID=A0A1J4KKL4_9EUKA|nr:hypothetical protein [Tritrichomonas foetus]OHT11849.1 hypothetical protein TRFO_18528 [Tritrichomonas foetus]|eukprot:OHT11849.1 hypothetical protein TRFO_18528 [Tritrichomonas foetus]
MFSDSLSDSSRGDSSTGVSHEIKKQQLKELNSELVKENALLRTQFEEAVEITAQLQDLHVKNQELVTQIRSVQTEKEDLEHRLEISLATNKELTKRLNEEKKNRSQQNDTNINAMNNEIERVKEQSKAQLDSVLEELEKVKAIHEKDVLQQKTIVGRIDRVLQSGERFFQAKFSTVDDLIDYFEKPGQPKPQQTQPVDSQPVILQSQYNNTEHLEKRLKHLKAKLRSAVHEKGDLQSELAKVQREAHLAKLDSKQQISDANSRIAALNEEHTSELSQKQNKISALEQQVDGMRAELNRLRNLVDNSSQSHQLPIPQPIVHQQPQPQQQREPVLPKINKKPNTQQENERIIQLTRTVDDLNEKVKIADKKKAEVEFKLHEADNQIQKQKGQIDHLRTEVSTLKSLNESNASEIESLRKALHTKKEPIQPEQIQPPRQSANVAKYQRAIEEHKGKILALNQLNDKLKKQIEKQEKDIEILNEKVEVSNAATKKVNDDFADYRSKVESKRPLSADDLLPPDAFRSTEFDGPLSACIAKIAGNPSLQPVSKLQSCFKAISAHYGKHLGDLQSAFDDTMKENQFLSYTFNKFIVDLSIAVCDQPTTIEDFFKGNGGQQLLQQIADFRVNYDDMKHQNEKFHDVMARLDEMFGCTGDPVQQITEVKNQFQNQLEIIAQKSSKLKKMRRELRDVIQAAEACKTESSHKIEDLTNAMNKLASQLSQLEKLSKQLKQENLTLQADLAEATVKANQNEEDFKRREQQIMNKLTAEHSDKFNQLTAKYNELSQTYSELVDDFNNQTEEVRRLDDLVESNKRTIAAKDREITDLTKKMSLDAEDAEDRLETEKRELRNTYERAINQLKDQCEMHRLDVEKMAKTVAENEKQCAIVKQEALTMKKEKIRTEQEMKSLRAKVDRERKLMETTFTAKRIAYETEVTKKLNDEKGRFEQEKRRICGYAVEAFKLFFDANTTIDEKAYRNVIDMAHDELTKLTRSDAAVRRICAARDGQTTEDSVAQVVMTSA